MGLYVKYITHNTLMIHSIQDFQFLTDIPLNMEIKSFVHP